MCVCEPIQINAFAFLLAIYHEFVCVCVCLRVPLAIVLAPHAARFAVLRRYFILERWALELCMCVCVLNSLCE